jgi:hypothetical protein
MLVLSVFLIRLPLFIAGSPPQAPNILIMGVSLMRTRDYQFKPGGKDEGLACREEFLAKLSALPGFTDFLKEIDPLHGSEVFHNEWEDLSWTMFRTLAGQSSGFHLDTITSTVAENESGGDDEEGDHSEESGDSDGVGVAIHHSALGASSSTSPLFYQLLVFKMYRVRFAVLQVKRHCSACLERMGSVRCGSRGNA